MEFDSKILLDAYKDIPDYPYGEQPPFGCRHVWVGVARGIEDKPEEANEPINGAAAKGDDTEKSVGNGELFPAGDQSKLTRKELELLQNADKEPLSNRIFDNTAFATQCNVKSYDFGNNYELGDYSETENTIRINSRLELSLKHGMCKIRNNIGYFTEDEILALDAYAHEWVHSVSNKTVFSDYRQTLKDILTEYVARSLVHERTGIMGFGGYDDEMDLFLLYKKKDVNSATTIMKLKSKTIDNISDIFKSFLTDESQMETILKTNNLTV